MVDFDGDAVFLKQVFQLLVFDIAFVVKRGCRYVFEKVGSNLLALSAAIDLVLTFLNFGLDFQLLLLDCKLQAHSGLALPEDKDAQDQAYGC